MAVNGTDMYRKIQEKILEGLVVLPFFPPVDPGTLTWITRFVQCRVCDQKVPEGEAAAHCVPSVRAAIKGVRQ